MKAGVAPLLSINALEGAWILARSDALNDDVAVRALLQEMIFVVFLGYNRALLSVQCGRIFVRRGLLDMLEIVAIR